MLDIVQKLLELSKSEKSDSLKIPSILCIIGCLLIFLSDKIPKEVAEGGLVQILGFLVLSIGFIFIVFVVVNDTFNVSIITGISDGIISGLLATFIVSSTLFAPVYHQSEDNLYINRILITLSYGMMYGGIVGLFASLFDRKAKIDILKSISVIASIFILFVYFLSIYIFPKMPYVQSEPMLVGQLFIIHMVFVVIFVIMYFKTFKIKNYKKPVLLYILTSSIVVLLLFLLKQRIFYPTEYGLDNEILWVMTFYTEEKPSIYAFGAIMVAFIVYVATNTIYALRTISISRGGDDAGLPPPEI